jgi:hypothetical protein
MYLFIYFFFLILGNINWNQVLAAGRPTLQNLQKKKKKKKVVWDPSNLDHTCENMIM